jgi:hypothetical protein
MTKQFRLVLSIIITGLLLLSFFPNIQAQNLTSDSSEQQGISLNTYKAIYNATNTQLVSSKNLSSVPYLVTEVHYVENGLLNNSVNVTNTETFVDTHISDKLQLGRGNGILVTPDGESITWITSGVGMLKGDQWTFYNIYLFDSTDSQSLAVLNNTLTISNSTTGPGLPDYMWILK